MSAVGGNYVSDAQLMAWVTTQQDRLYADLKDSMSFQQMQGQMTSELADIKQELLAANKDVRKFPELEEKIQAFVDKYGGVPEFSEIVHSLRDIGEELHTKVGEMAEAEAEGESDSMIARVMTAAFQFDDATIDSWIKALDEKLDATGVNEQLGMIHLSELKNNIDQSSQQASQMLKSNNDTTSSIINNIA